MSSRKYSINEALIDPKRVFGSPESVVSDPRLDRRTKLEILGKWRHNAHERSTAVHEGKIGDEPSLLRRVQQAIDYLSRNDER